MIQNNQCPYKKGRFELRQTGTEGSYGRTESKDSTVYKARREASEETDSWNLAEVALAG